MTSVQEVLRAVVIGTFLVTVSVAAAGCPDDDGPFEEAGEELDEAADDIEDAVD